MLVVATAADCQKGFYKRLEAQLSYLDIKFIYYELKPFNWADLVLWERGVAETYLDSIVCFVDTWDFLFQGMPRDIESALGDSDILYHSEARCWPEPHKADFYPDAPTPYRYVNGTGPCGWGGAIMRAIDYGLKHFPIRGKESSIFADNDQRFWTDLFLAGYGKVDYDCRLSVSLNAVSASDFSIVGKRLRLNSGVYPAFLHANGASKHKYADMLESLQ